MKRKIYSFLTLMLSIMMLACCLVACNADGTTDAVLAFAYEDKVCISITETDGKANAFDALKSLRNKDLNDKLDLFLNIIDEDGNGNLSFAEV